MMVHDGGNDENYALIFQGFCMACKNISVAIYIIDAKLQSSHSTNKLSEQYIIVTMCMLPAQYHVWLAIFTPLIADKFLVRTKEYIKIAGMYGYNCCSCMYAYSELQKIIKAM